MAPEPTDRDAAREHAERAHELLDGAERYARQLDELSPEDRLQAAALGGIARANADLRWTVELAVSHALVALALVAVDGGLET